MHGEQAGRPAAPRAELDGQQASAQIEHDFPEVTAWFGTATRTWWAMVPIGTGWRLVEAVDPVELREAIRQRAIWPWPRSARLVQSPSTPQNMRRGISG